MTDYRTTHTPHATHTSIEQRKSSGNGIVLFILGGVVAVLAIMWFAMGSPTDSVVDDAPAPAVTAPADPAPEAIAPAAPMTPAPEATPAPAPEATPEPAPAPDATMPEAPAPGTGSTTQP